MEPIADAIYEMVTAHMTGFILIWSGLLADVPDGWHICDGNGGTIDLRSRFVYGASIDDDVEDTGDSSNHLHLFVDDGHTHGTVAHDHTVDAHLHQVNTHRHYHDHPVTESSGSTNCDNDGTSGMGGPNCSHTHRLTLATQWSSYDAPFTDEKSPETNEAAPNTDVSNAIGNTELAQSLPPWMKLFYIQKV